MDSRICNTTIMTIYGNYWFVALHNATPIYIHIVEGCDATYGNICYTHHTSGATWQQASDACEALGAQLVDIEDERENEIILSMITGKIPSLFWLAHGICHSRQ